MQKKQRIIFIFLIIFIWNAHFSYTKELTKSFFLKHRAKIEHQVRHDLAGELNNIEGLEIIPVPFCEVIVKDRKKILELDTLYGLAIILSNGKFVDYALKLQTATYKLHKFKEDPTIYLGRSVIFSSYEVSKCYGENLFAIYIVDPSLMMGFGIYKGFSIKYFNATSTEIIKFRNRRMFFKSFKRLINDYDKIIKIF